MDLDDLINSTLSELVDSQRDAVANSDVETPPLSSGHLADNIWKSTASCEASSPDEFNIKAILGRLAESLGNPAQEISPIEIVRLQKQLEDSISNGGLDTLGSCGSSDTSVDKDALIREVSQLVRELCPEDDQDDIVQAAIEMLSELDR
jgi:hypothetical protein